MPETIVARGVRVHNLQEHRRVLCPHRRLVVSRASPDRGRAAWPSTPSTPEGQRRERGEPLRLRPAVPRADGQAGRGVLRRHLPGHRHPAAGAVTQSALHGGSATEIHDYLRLLFARAGRTVCDSCGEVVTRDHRGIGRRTGSSACRKGADPDRGFPVSAADSARRPRRPPPEARLPAGARGRRGRAVRRRHRKRPRGPTPWWWWWTGSGWPARRGREWWRPWRRPSRGRGPRAGPGRGRAEAPVLRGVRVRAVRAPVRGAAGPAVLVQQPFGACPTCHGFGNLVELDQELVVPDTSKTLAEGAIAP
jgi:excinuclease ABC subunit A